jgi:nicotinate-nucleotide adenylyltransferase
LKPAIHIFTSHAWRNLRVGLLGGSFNPAHEGHLHISLYALKKMRLHAVWWLVSPQNPLKSAKEMAAFERRLEGAAQLVKHHPRIIVTGLEGEIGTRYTADTLAKLRRTFSHTRFVWMMGVDNLLQIPRWQRWTQIFRKTDVAVFRRPPHLANALHGIAALRFKNRRLDPRRATHLGQGKKAHWILLDNSLNQTSATRIREGIK